MRTLILIIFLICSISINAANYYVSADGNDSNSGTLTTEAWKTLAKVNATTFSAGDWILFRRGDTFTGTLTVGQSGTAGNVIKFGAYGSGANPIITGFTSVTEWTNLGSNIWESTNAVSTLTSCYMVYINGVNTPMGRTPNLGSYYTFQSHNANTSITSSNLTGTPNWTGAEVVIRKERWIWQVGQITSQSGSTISYTDDGVFTPRDDWGFFIQDDARTLDAQNEWYYNPTTKKIRIYSTSQPTNVKIASSDYVVTASSKSYVTLENLTLTGANTSIVYVVGGSYFNIQGCTLKYGGLDGVSFNYANYLTVNNSTIKHANYAAVYSSGHNTYETITNNVIDSAAMVIGIGRLYAPGAIYTNGDNVFIQYNSIDHSGYIGIFPANDNGEVRNNYINNSMINRGDGGGIYTAGAHTNLIIDGNIINNSIGYSGAMKASDIAVGLLAHGIYLDMPSTNVTVSNNTVVNSTEHGIFINQRSYSNSVTGNTCFNNGDAQFAMSDLTSEVGVTHDNIVTGNKFIAKGATQWVMKFQSLLDNIPSWFSSMNNNVLARPIDDTNCIAAIQPSEYGAPAYKTLAEWKTFSSLDANSTKAPKAISTTSDIDIRYNATASQAQISFSWAGINMSGVQYASNPTIPTYSSLVLIKNIPNPTGNKKAWGSTNKIWGKNGVPWGAIPPN